MTTEGADLQEQILQEAAEFWRSNTEVLTPLAALHLVMNTHPDTVESWSPYFVALMFVRLIEELAEDGVVSEEMERRHGSTDPS
jgi:hypothetical protein